MKKEVSYLRFIHAADLHLGTPFQGLMHLPDLIIETLQEAPYQAYNQLINFAVQEKVDFVCIAGDIYDQGGLNIKAQVRFKQGLEKLFDHEIPVFLIYGNHDYLVSEDQILPYPKNTYVLSASGETQKFESVNGEKIAISGFSYNRRHITEQRIDSLPNRLADVDYHIGMWHGQVERSISADNVYAPVTLNELSEKQYDYFALGHIHAQETLDKNGRIRYSGCTQGRHINESGEKGIYLVDCQPHTVSSQFKPTAPLVFETIHCHFEEEVLNLSTIYEKVKEKVLILQEKYRQVLFKIQLTFNKAPSAAIYQQIEDPAFKEAFSQIISPHHFYWAFDMSWEMKEESLWETHLAQLDQSEIKQLIADSLAEGAFAQETAELFAKVPRDFYYQDFDDDKIKSLTEKALKWL